VNPFPIAAIDDITATTTTAIIGHRGGPPRSLSELFLARDRDRRDARVDAFTLESE
jgi:hypothetical protein